MSTDAKVLIGIGAITLLVMVGVVALSSRDSSPQEAVTTVAPENRERLVRADSQKITAANASITLVEFADLECESCRAAHPIVKKILAEYPDKITFVLRNFPLHKNSVLAAKTAEAAGEQGKFWEMQDLLFKQQSEWGEKQTPQTELFIKYAEQLGLNKERFIASLDNEALATKIERDRQDGLALGIKGTPTFFLNGKVIPGVPSYEEFKQLVETELQAAAAP